MAYRGKGKAVFAHIRSFRKNSSIFKTRCTWRTVFEVVKKIGVGDIIGVEGEIFITKTGELTLRASLIKNYF